MFRKRGGSYKPNNVDHCKPQFVQSKRGFRGYYYYLHLPVSMMCQGQGIENEIEHAKK